MTPSDNPRSSDELKATHSIADRIDGWHFRVVERSPGCHHAEAINAKGRAVSANGPDAESALSMCARDVELRMKTWAARRAAKSDGGGNRGSVGLDAREQRLSLALVRGRGNATCCVDARAGLIAL